MMPPPTPTSPTRSPVPRPAVTRTTACIHSISTTAFLGIAIQLDHHHLVNDYRREARARPIRFAADQPPFSAIRHAGRTRGSDPTRAWLAPRSPGVAARVNVPRTDRRRHLSLFQ